MSNFIEVEGDWNGFYIKPVFPADRAQVVDYMIPNYILDEPVHKWLATSNNIGFPEEFVSDCTQFYERVLSQNLSLMAIDQATNQIAGVRLTRNHTRKDDFCNFQFDSRAFRAMFDIKSYLEKEANILERFGVNRYADLTGASVAKAYRRKGLLSEMYRRSLTLYKTLGFEVTKSVFLNPISHKAGLKLGFTELSRAYYSEFNDEDGYPYFPNYPHPEHFAPLMVLEI